MTDSQTYQLGEPDDVSTDTSAALDATPLASETPLADDAPAVEDGDQSGDTTKRRAALADRLVQLLGGEDGLTSVEIVDGEEDPTVGLDFEDGTQICVVVQDA